MISVCRYCQAKKSYCISSEVRLLHVWCLSAGPGLGICDEETRLDVETANHLAREVMSDYLMGVS